jgi:hypothetical protein
MTTAIDPLLDSNLLVVWVAIFALLAGAGECGFRLGRWRLARHHEEADDASRTGISTLTAGMFALLAFSLGLTINMAQDRFEARRDLVVQEANAIGTAWLRARMIAQPEGDAMAAMIEDYAKVRLDFTTAQRESDIPPLLERTNTLQNQIWRQASLLAQRKPDPVTTSVVMALNEMIDTSMSQRFTFASRAPLVLVLGVLFGSMLTAGAMGYLLGATGNRQGGLAVLALAMWAGGILIIVDFNHARLGGIRVDPAPLVWTIEGFAPTPAAK